MKSFEQVSKEFKEELRALLLKYGAVIDANDNNPRRNISIDIDFPWKHSDGVCVQEGGFLEFDAMISGEDL